MEGILFLNQLRFFFGVCLVKLSGLSCYLRTSILVPDFFRQFLRGVKIEQYTEFAMKVWS